MNNKDFEVLVRSAIDEVVEQGALGKSGLGGCQYTSYNVESGEYVCCPIGHMMPDDNTRQLADSWDDGGSEAIACLYQCGFPWAEQFTEEQIMVMSDLQQAHDAEDTTIGTFKALCSDVYKQLESLSDVERQDDAWYPSVPTGSQS